MSNWFDDLKTPKFKGDTSSSKVAKIPEGLWGKCANCNEIIQTRQLQENLSVCPECDHHIRISALERVALLTDENSFKPYGTQIQSNDPLKFDDQKPYQQRLDQAIKTHKINDALIAGKATCNGLPFHLGVFEFKFMGGSMGVMVEKKITMVLKKALENKFPAVIVSASG